MIQDILPYHYDLTYIPSKPSAGDSVIIFQGNQVYLTKDNDYPARSTLNQFTSIQYQFLFTIENRKFFLALLPDDFLFPQINTLNCVSTRQLRTLRPMYLAFAGYTAWHLYHWYRSSRYCGYCGAKTVPGMDERKVICSSCHTPIYPRINPCIIVAVHDGDRLLMTKYAGRPVTWFVLIAGFIEIGETAEDTVHREVMEETGIKVKNIRYFNSQPWGIPGNLTLGFTAELDGPDQITLDTGELAEGKWFQRKEVPAPNDELSITSALIHAFIRGEF